MAGVTEAPDRSLTSRAQVIERRRGRYTAQALELFEERLEKRLKSLGLLARYPELAEAVDDVKGVFRSKLNALSTDATEIMYLADSNMVQNGYAAEITDTLRQDGAATKGATHS